MNAALVAVWMAFAPDATLPPAPKPVPCCAQCKGTGMVAVNDPNLGGNVKVWCACTPNCACAANRPKPKAPCATGTCPPGGKR